jgi:hypothetical protein
MLPLLALLCCPAYSHVPAGRGVDMVMHLPGYHWRAGDTDNQEVR